MNKTNPNISIIIPVYESEKYVEKAINSVLNQDYYNIEIIVVLDPGRDKTEMIISQYESNDRVIIIKRAVKGGVSSARNLGLIRSRGNYVIFLDADDYLNDCSLRLSMKEIEKTNADFCYYGHYSHQNDKQGKLCLFNTTNSDVLLDYLFGKLSIANSGQLLIKKEILSKYCINFNENCNNAEDTEFRIKLFTVGLGAPLKCGLLHKVEHYDSLSHIGNSEFHEQGRAAHMRALAFIEKYRSIEISQLCKQLIVNDWLPIRDAEYIFLSSLTKKVASERHYSNTILFSSISSFRPTSFKKLFIYFSMWWAGIIPCYGHFLKRFIYYKN